MAVNEAYRAQVALLMRIIPLVAEEEVFALKGGTAINLFVRDLPRLSVDIDLTYLPIANRATSLAGIDAAMKRVAARIGRVIGGAAITRVMTEDCVTKLLVRAGGAQVKIELSPVMRGTAYEPELRSVTPHRRRRLRLCRNPRRVHGGPVCREALGGPRPSAPP
jgi:hypothetical protein